MCPIYYDKEIIIIIYTLKFFFQIRVGVDGHGIEDLLYHYGVDLHYQAHEHSYERFWPTYNFTVSVCTNAFNN